MISILTAGAIGMLFSLLLTPWFIRGFKRLQWGQFIREDGPKSHHSKRGTATMGGIIIIFGAIVGYFLAHLILPGVAITPSGLLVLLLMVGCGAVGFADDFMKVRRQRSLGIGGWTKIAGITAASIVFGLLALQFPDENGLTPASTHISAVRDTSLDLFVWGSAIGVVLVLAWIALIANSTANAVNLADGLDGLATGASILSIGSYVVIGYWQANQSCFSASSDILQSCYTVRDPLDLAVVAAAITGALIGFLWWNTSPAQIFMGDTGSLGLGGAIAALAIVSRTELLLVLIGALFLIEVSSVIIQRMYFKATHGRRIFLMSPIHHHFELKGWTDVTIVVRFWITHGIFVAAGIGLFYAEWNLFAG